MGRPSRAMGREGEEPRGRSHAHGPECTRLGIEPGWRSTVGETRVGIGGVEEPEVVALGEAGGGRVAGRSVGGGRPAEVASCQEQRGCCAPEESQGGSARTKKGKEVRVGEESRRKRRLGAFGWIGRVVRG